MKILLVGKVYTSYPSCEWAAANATGPRTCLFVHTTLPARNWVWQCDLHLTAAWVLDRTSPCQIHLLVTVPSRNIRWITRITVQIYIRNSEKLNNNFQCNCLKISRDRYHKSKFLHRPLHPYPSLHNNQSEKLFKKTLKHFALLINLLQKIFQGVINNSKFST